MWFRFLKIFFRKHGSIAIRSELATYWLIPIQLFHLVNPSFNFSTYLFRIDMEMVVMSINLLEGEYKIMVDEHIYEFDTILEMKKFSREFFSRLFEGRQLYYVCN